MYVIKVMHGYIDKSGARTRKKDPKILMVFTSQVESVAFAHKIGGHVKPLAQIKSEHE